VDKPVKFVLVLLIAVSTCANAADLAILRNGNAIRHERRQIIGPVTRLYLSDAASSYIEIPTDQIERFEVDTAPPPAPSKPQLPVPQAAQPAPPSATFAQPRAAVTPSSTAITRSLLNTPGLDRVSLGRVVAGAGERHQIDPDFINSVIRAESGFNSRAVSKKGAQGLMQLMPQTASQLGVANSFDPNANVEGGTKYLRELLEKYNFDVVKALAAYNAGPQRVEQYHGIPPYYETRAYVARIIRDFNRQKLAENPALAGKKTSTAQHHKTQERKATTATTPPQAGMRASR
jgi:transglycosylase-like protein with SLT domain